MQKFIFILIISIVSFLSAKAQVSVVEDYNVQSVMDQYAATNRMNSIVLGWRIQLMATTDRRKMEDAKEDFMTKYPFLKIDWVHAAPYYKLLVGAYQTKLEAARVIYQVKPDYPGAYPAQDQNIKAGEFVGFYY